MSGLGGGGSILIWLQEEERAEYLDFYSAQRPASFEGITTDEGSRTDLRRVAIPGEVAGLLAAHERFGKLSRAEVLAPAIRMAEEGYPVNQILAQMIARDSAKLARYPESNHLFLPEGRPIRAGELLRQPELAATLRRLVESGRDGFYRGEVAAELVRALNAGGHPATLADLAAYEPQWKRPLCGEYRDALVLSAPPPQTGVQILETLKLLEPYDLASIGLPTESARAFDIITSALRVGMSESRHIDDPNWAASPVVGISSAGYAKQRGEFVGTGNALWEIPAGDPTPFDKSEPTESCAELDPYRAGSISAVTSQASAPAVEMEAAGGETTHLSVVDAAGNAVALTHTNSSIFGTGAWVAGFFLNDSGIDFSRAPSSGDSEVEGRHEWRIRRSTISPTIMLRDGRAIMVIGAPGSGRIPTEITQNIVYVLDYGLDPQAALRIPRIYPAPRTPLVQLENGFDATLLEEIRGLGYDPTAESYGYARLYLIARQGDHWVGAADPRHDGGARGY
jgi:gamma-glutamyltranspeptidase/glutathione hydrolase